MPMIALLGNATLHRRHDATPATAASVVFFNIFDNLSTNAIRAHLWYSGYVTSRFTPLVYFPLGVLANLACLLVWSRRAMHQHNSSAIFLTLLAFSDLLFWPFNLLNHLEDYFEVLPAVHAHFTYLCQMRQALHLFFQYISVPLVAAFTLERYLMVAHPFSRFGRLCTRRNSKLASLLICAVTGVYSCVMSHLLFYEAAHHRCTFKADHGWFGTCRLVWELLISVVLPLVMLSINVLLVQTLRRIVRREQQRLHSFVVDGPVHSASHRIPLKSLALGRRGGGSRVRGGSRGRGRSVNRFEANRNCTTAVKSTVNTTIMLLSVSYLLIATVLPMGIMYPIQSYIPIGPTNMTIDQIRHSPEWKPFIQLQLAMSLLMPFGLLHFLVNLFIYLASSGQFRKEFSRIFLCSRIADYSQPKASKRFQLNSHQTTTRTANIRTSDEGGVSQCFINRNPIKRWREDVCHNKATAIDS